MCMGGVLGGDTYCFIELHLLLQVEADDSVVIIDPVTVKVIHLSCNKISTQGLVPRKAWNNHMRFLCLPKTQQQDSIRPLL